MGRGEYSAYGLGCDGDIFGASGGDDDLVDLVVSFVKHLLGGGERDEDDIVHVDSEGHSDFLKDPDHEELSAVDGYAFVEGIGRAEDFLLHFSSKDADGAIFVAVLGGDESAFGGFQPAHDLPFFGNAVDERVAADSVEFGDAGAEDDGGDAEDSFGLATNSAGVAQARGEWGQLMFRQR